MIAVDGGAGEDPHLGHHAQLGERALDPAHGRGAVDPVATVEQAAAELARLLGEDHPGTGAPGGECGGQSGRAGARHQHVAVRVDLLVGVGIGRARGLAQARGLADEMLVAHPGGARPHEGLVVEAGRQEAAHELVDAERVALRAGPAIDAGGHQAVVKGDLGRSCVRHRGRRGAELDQRVRLLDTGGDDAARPVVLEAASDEVDAVGQQRRGQRVAGTALIGLAVERETERPRAVDAAALLQAKPQTVALRHAGSSEDTGSSRRWTALMA